MNCWRAGSYVSCRSFILVPDVTILGAVASSGVGSIYGMWSVLLHALEMSAKNALVVFKTSQIDFFIFSIDKRKDADNDCRINAPERTRVQPHDEQRDGAYWLMAGIPGFQGLVQHLASSSAKPYPWTKAVRCHISSRVLSRRYSIWPIHQRDSSNARDIRSVEGHFNKQDEN